MRPSERFDSVLFVEVRWRAQKVILVVNIDA